MGELFIPIVSGVLGSQIGSFLNVYILRYPEGRSLGGRSHCPHCKKTLRWFDLIPVVSFIIQKGRCRSCSTVLSLQYPIIELFTAVLFAATPLLLAQYLSPACSVLLATCYVPVLFAGWTALSAAIVITVIDVRHFLIPDGAVAAIFLSAIPLVLMRAVDVGDMLRDLAAAIVYALILAAFWFFSRGRWMGFGDVKLIFATSLFVGFPASVAAFVFAFWGGAAVGISLLLLKQTTLKSPLPFGPFILLGALAAFVFSESLFGTIGVLF